VTLPDRIDPRPPKHIYRWDLDKTYLQSEFDTFRQLMRSAFQKASDKVAIPGAAALIRELRARGDSKLFILSGSPKQMRAVLEGKLRLDGVEWDELVLKDNVRNLLRGRFRALRGQLGFKLNALLESRAATPVDSDEILFGDDAEADAFIYSLYADLIAGRVKEDDLRKIVVAAELYRDEVAAIFRSLEKISTADPVRRIFIHLDRLTPPAVFSTFGPRVVPVFNYFQAALVLLGDGALTAPQVLRVAAEMVQSAGYNLLMLSNSFQDLIRRGLPLDKVAASLTQALDGPEALLSALRPMPDIVAAFSKRIAALGTPPAPPAPVSVDYLALLKHARPRTGKQADPIGE